MIGLEITITNQISNHSKITVKESTDHTFHYYQLDQRREEPLLYHSTLSHKTELSCVTGEDVNTSTLFRYSDALDQLMWSVEFDKGMQYLSQDTLKFISFIQSKKSLDKLPLKWISVMLSLYQECRDLQLVPLVSTQVPGSMGGTFSKNKYAY